MNRPEFHRLAEYELNEAAQYYDLEESGLGAAFLDFNRGGKPIGIEIRAPEKLSAATLNRVLRRFRLPTVTRADLAPLRAA